MHTTTRIADHRATTLGMFGTTPRVSSRSRAVAAIRLASLLERRYPQLSPERRAQLVTTPDDGEHRAGGS